MFPKAINRVALASDQMRVEAITRQARKSRERVLRPSLDHRSVAQQGQAFQLSLSVATSVKRSTILRAAQSVVTDQTGHENRVNRTRGQELQRFSLIFL